MHCQARLHLAESARIFPVGSGSTVTADFSTETMVTRIICMLTVIRTLGVLRTDHINKCHITVKPSWQFLYSPFYRRQRHPVVNTKKELSHTHNASWFTSLSCPHPLVLPPSPSRRRRRCTSTSSDSASFFFMFDSDPCTNPLHPP